MTLAGAPDRAEAIEVLLARLTWAQKLAQLQIAYRPRFEDAAALVRSGIGAVFWPGDAGGVRHPYRRFARVRAAGPTDGRGAMSARRMSEGARR